MKKFRCTSSIIVCCDSEDCDYIYDPAKGDKDHGIEPGVEFEDLPESWICPNCGAGKEAFKEIK